MGSTVHSRRCFVRLLRGWRVHVTPRRRAFCRRLIGTGYARWGGADAVLALEHYGVRRVVGRDAMGAELRTYTTITGPAPAVISSINSTQLFCINSHALGTHVPAYATAVPRENTPGNSALRGRGCGGGFFLRGQCREGMADIAGGVGSGYAGGKRPPGDCRSQPNRVVRLSGRALNLCRIAHALRRQFQPRPPEAGRPAPQPNQCSNGHQWAAACDESTQDTMSLAPRTKPGPRAARRAMANKLARSPFVRIAALNRGFSRGNANSFPA